MPLIFGDPLTNSGAFLLSQIRAIQIAQGLPVAESPLVDAVDESPRPNPNLVGGYAGILTVQRRHAQRHGRREDSIPFKNKTAEANLAGARIQKEQLMASTRAQEQIIEVDVRNSAQAVESAHASAFGS